MSEEKRKKSTSKSKNICHINTQFKLPLNMTQSLVLVTERVGLHHSYKKEDGQCFYIHILQPTLN